MILRFLIVLITSLALLAACDNKPLDQHNYSKSSMSNIPELADCVYIRIEDVRILRCPKSDTSLSFEVPQGKGRKTVTTIVTDDK
jgi:hypothetical protein